MSLGGRVGVFLVFIGVIALFIFYISIRANSANLLYCCSGWLLVIMGGYAAWLGRNPELPKDQRFSTLRKLRGRKKKK
jgi:hypothetical protein